MHVSIIIYVMSTSPMTAVHTCPTRPIHCPIRGDAGMLYHYDTLVEAPLDMPPSVVWRIHKHYGEHKDYGTRRLIIQHTKDIS